LSTGAGQTLSVTFTPTETTDYTSATATATITVTQATPVITWANPAAIVYGTPLSGTQLDATANVLGNFTYSPAAGTVLSAGAGQTLSVTFTPTDTTDYTSPSATAKINVTKATPVITWANPADIVYGTALSGTQLDASASVPGSFTYSPAAGTVLSGGTGRTLSTTFTPTDTTDYDTVKSTATINVAQATPVITWANPAAIVYGTALSSKQLDAKANAAGTFTYSPAAGTVLSTGAGQTLSVTFTPTETTDYTSATATVTINVDNPPGPAIVHLVTTRRKPSILSVARLVADGTSGSRGPLTVTAVSPRSAQGGTVVMADGQITHTPPDSFVGLDSFTYTLFDGTGSAEGTVQVTVTSENAPLQNSLSIVNSGGDVFLEFTGIPGVDYVVQSASSPEGPWSDLSDPLTADATGLVTYLDSNLQSPEFYRTRVDP
jgi:hypothetical protein